MMLHVTFTRTRTGSVELAERVMYLQYRMDGARPYVSIFVRKRKLSLFSRFCLPSALSWLMKAQLENAPLKTLSRVEIFEQYSFRGYV